MGAAAQRTKRREQREQTRREILAAADRLLRERPYRELSVDLVMAQTGLTRTAFYRHFDDVPDLVLRLLGSVGRELFDAAARWRTSDPLEFVAAGHDTLAEIVDFFMRHGRLVRAVKEAAATDEVIEVGYARFVDGFTDLIVDALQRLAAHGWLDVPDVRALARALNLMNEAFLLDEFGTEPLGDPVTARATLEAIWVRVIAAPGSGR
jgi:AcrR family transcriptional regulator